MKDPDLRFNILTAAALGVVIVLGPTAARVAADEASGRMLARTLANPTSIPSNAPSASTLESAADGRNSLTSGTPPPVRTTFRCGRSV